MLTLGSLFDGLGGWQLAAAHAGVKPIWSSEVEKFPLALTKIRFPETEQLGDVTKIDGTKLKPVDIVCAGSPCQNLSVAGNREGLAGEQSGLFRESIRIIRQLRKSTGGGRFFVWENVPGAFTSGSERGADFRAVLESIAETSIPMPKDGRWANAGMVQCPKCEIAWRVLDAQYWGVPQRRKRIFLVADFAESDRRAAKILFVSKGVSGDSEQGRETRERTASTVEKSIRTASEIVHRGGTFDVRISSDGTHNFRAHCYETDICRSLDTHAPDPNTNHGGVAILEKVYDCRNGKQIDKSQTLNTDCRQVCGKQNAQVVVSSNDTPLVLNDQGGSVMNVSKNVCGTLRVEAHGNVPCIMDMTHANDVIRESKGLSPTLNARMGTGGNQVLLVFALEGNGSRESHHGPGFTDSDKMYTLNTVEHHAVAYCMGHDERSAQFEKNKTDPLTASDYKQPPVVAQPVSTTGGQVYAIGNGQLDQLKMSAKVGALNCMHDQIAVMQELVTESKQSEACALMTDEDSTDKM